MSEKNYGLRLTLGGAPNTPHTVVGIPGVYRPDPPTPVGGPGELSLEAARAASKDKAVPLDLVEIPAGKVEAHRDQAFADFQASREAATQARRDAKGAEVEQVKDELAATAGQE